MRVQTHPYFELFADRGWRRWTITTALARLTIAMAPLALVLAGRYATGSFADGAVLAGAYAFAESLAAPYFGRRLDRRERRGGLARGLLGSAAGLAALLAAVLLRAPLALLLSAAIVAGVLPSAVQGGLRSFLPELVGERAGMAYALDAVLLELEWLAAPALVALVAFLGLPYLAVGAMLVASLAALAALRLLPRLTIAIPVGDTAASPWRNGVARRAYFVSFVLGFAEGSITVVLAPMLASLHRSPAGAGVLLVIASLSSAVGGLVVAELCSRSNVSHELLANLLLVALGFLCLPLFFASTVAALVAGSASFGFLVAPLNGLRTRLLTEGVPPFQLGEAHSILYAAMGIGVGLSGVIAGALLHLSGPGAVVIVGAAVPILGGASALLVKGSAPVRSRLSTPC